MARDLFDQPLEKIHEALGNDPGQWLLSATALNRAAEILYTNIGEPQVPTASAETAWQWFSMHNIGRMLRGMALECLLKAAWVARGGVLVENSRFIGIPGVKSHDLYAMFVAVCQDRQTVLTGEEKKLLARLAFAIASARYPIGKSPTGDFPSAPASRGKMQWNKCEHQTDADLFLSLWAKLEILVAEHCDQAQQSAGTGTDEAP